MTGKVSSVTHRLPSLPVAIPKGAPPPPPKAKLLAKNCVVEPSGAMLEMKPEQSSAIQTLPSGPGVMCSGQTVLGGVNCVMTPAGVMRPTPAAPLTAVNCVNHRLPSGPVAMKFSLLPAGRLYNGVRMPDRLILATLPLLPPFTIQI